MHITTTVITSYSESQIYSNYFSKVKTKSRSKFHLVKATKLISDCYLQTVTYFLLNFILPLMLLRLDKHDTKHVIGFILVKEGFKKILRQK